MQWHNANSYILALLFAAAFAVFVSVLVGRRRVPGAQSIVGLGVTAAIWSFGYAMEISTVGTSWALVWARIQYVGIAFLPFAWVVFAYSYADRLRKLYGFRLAGLLAVSFVMLALVWTNDMHHLVWRAITLDTTLPVPLLVYDHGIAFWIFNIFSHLCLLAGTLVLFGTLRHAPLLYVRQIIVLLAGALAPWIGNAVYVSGLAPWPGLDLTPFAFAFTLAMVTILVLRMRFLDLVPVAYERVVASMSDGVLILDRLDRVLDMNPAGLMSVGKTLPEVIGKPVYEVLWRVADLVDHYRDVTYFDDEIEVDMDGLPRQYFNVRITPMMAADGRPRGKLVVWRDVTERRQAEELLRNQNEELVRLHTFLERAIDEARTANRAKSSFLANVSHELRTPLNAILGYSELMQIELERERSNRFDVELASIQTAGKQLLDLINSLLDLSKIEANRVELQAETFQFSELLSEVRQIVMPLMSQSGNNLALDCDERVGQICTDRSKLRQILLNLLSNAAKFTNRGDIQVTARRVQQPGQPDMLTVAVQDTGIGISADDIPMLFQDFVQVDASSTRRYGGTGLGLAISRRFSHLIGGDITVASTLGHGATFTITLPADIETCTPTSPDAGAVIVKRAS